MKYLLSLLAPVVLAAATILLVDKTSQTKQEDNANAARQKTTRTWTVISAGVGDTLRDLQFLDENTGWAVTASSLWRTTDGGQSWAEVRKARSVTLLKDFEPQETMEKVQFLTQNQGWVLEGSYLMHTTDGGASWERHKPDNVTIRSVRFLDQENGWFVGQLLRQPARRGEVERWNPVIYRTSDGGGHWRRLYIGPEDHYPLWDVWPISSKDIWAVGSSILHSLDGGEIWNKVQLKVWPGVSGMPVEVRFLDSTVGWMKTNEPGGYFFTSDGGKTWEPRPVSIVAGGFADVAYVSKEEAWGAARALYYSSDSGATWTKVCDGDYSRIEYVSTARCVLTAGRTVARYRLP